MYIVRSMDTARRLCRVRAVSAPAAMGYLYRISPTIVILAFARRVAKRCIYYGNGVYYTHIHAYVYRYYIYLPFMVVSKNKNDIRTNEIGFSSS